MERALRGQTRIAFRSDSVVDPEIHKRAFRLASVAFATGAKVNICNYESDACDRAAYIELTK